MIVARTLAELDSVRDGGKMALVPTMGAFHEGHIQLMRKARSADDRVVVSLFVNPTQFAEGEDFERYPRDFDRDASIAESAGVDILFAPSVETMYPQGISLSRRTSVVVGELGTRWEGASRPGHFDGVATIVLKLFQLVRPERALFGLKDLQQCLVIRQMVTDFNVNVQLCFEATVREDDGLAKSSRNVYLSEQERRIAPKLYESLLAVARKIAEEKHTVDAELRERRQTLIHSGFEVDYLEVVDLESMSISRDEKLDLAVIVAAKLGRTRLIDNVRSSDILPN